MKSKPRILFLVTEDWYFLSHRLPLARAARDAGAEVLVATRYSVHQEKIAADGFKTIALEWDRGSLNPFKEAFSVLRLAVLYYQWRPDIVHHVAMKPILLGSLAAKITGWLGVKPHIVNAVTGLGYFFIGPNVSLGADSNYGRHSGDNIPSRNGSGTILRYLVHAALRFALGGLHTTVIVQNEDDTATLRDHHLLNHSRIRIIRGSGVDVKEFPQLPAPRGPLVAALVARMLSDKGVRETVEASSILKRQGVDLKVWLVGPTDPANPAAIPQEKLQKWDAEGIVKWIGPRKDIAAIWAEAAIAVLPSYREGLPKALLEAASCGRPLVATDAPGCREICRNQETGLLVPIGDAKALAQALAALAKDQDLRVRLGATARRVVEQEFSTEKVVKQTMTLYQELLPGRFEGSRR